MAEILPPRPDGPDRTRARTEAAKADARLLADRRRAAAARALGSPGAASRPGPPVDELPARNDDPVLYEVKASALGGDIDDAGKRLVVLADRVELRDAKDRVRESMPIGDIARVELRRRLSSATLVITSLADARLEVTGLRAGPAAEARQVIAGLRLPDDEPADIASVPTAAALRRLHELAAMGLLSDTELAAKKAMLLDRPGYGA
jgi:hypothetical protein